VIGKIVLITGIVAALFAAVEVDAKADPLSFVQSLNDHGVYVYDVTLAVGNGYAMCDALRTTSPAQVAVNVYNQTTYSDVPNLRTAVVWVVSAAQELCPEMINTVVQR